MQPVFFAQALNGIGYPRCVLPARAIGAEVIELGSFLNQFTRETPPEDVWSPFAGRTAIWQIPATWASLHAMRDYRRITGGAVLAEVDDDYTIWDRGYIRDQVQLGVLDSGIGWIEEDVPEFGHPGISSPHVHRRALAEADAVIVSTDHLAKQIGVINRNTFVCRNLVDPSDWPELDQTIAGRGADGSIDYRGREGFRIVFSASPNLQDLRLIRPAMEWAAKQEGVEAIVVGYRPRWRGVREIGWINNLNEYRQTMSDLRPDIWLRPIETTRFSRSKSDLKILEAAAVGALPIVTPYDPYLGWRETPVRFALTPKDWQQELRWAIRHRDTVRLDAVEVRRIVLETRGLAAAREDWPVAIGRAEVHRQLLRVLTPA